MERKQGDGRCLSGPGERELPGHALVLGIESSCDEMAAAVVSRSGAVLSSVVQGQQHVHRPYGGVVSELASRDHVQTVSQVVSTALEQADRGLGDLSGIAVTAGPGLLGSLLVGLSFGKALGYRLRLPVVAVHHLEGHLAAGELSDPALQPPYLGLVVSGGHTALVRVGRLGRTTLLGETRDDAVGEAFDKVAKLLGLPYPGGPELARLAEEGREDAVVLPRPMLDRPEPVFSYSGLKTAVALAVEARQPLSSQARADLAASFQAAATDVLVAKTRRALRAEGLGQVSVVGGVAANARLRGRMEQAARADGFQVVFPPADLCTDNAAMIAAAGLRRLAAGERAGLDLTAFSRAPLGTAPWQPRP